MMATKLWIGDKIFLVDEEVAESFDRITTAAMDHAVEKNALKTENERLTDANNFNCKTLDEMEALLLAEQAKVASLQARVDELERRISLEMLYSEDMVWEGAKLEARVEELQNVVDAIKYLRYEDAVAGVKLWDEIRKLIATAEQGEEND